MRERERDRREGEIGGLADRETRAYGGRQRETTAAKRVENDALAGKYILSGLSLSFYFPNVWPFPLLPQLTHTPHASARVGRKNKGRPVGPNNGGQVGVFLRLSLSELSLSL